MRLTRLAVPAALAVVASGLVTVSVAASATSTPAPAAPKIVTSLAPVTSLNVAASPSGERLHWSNPSSSYAGVVVRRAPGRVAPASPTSGTAIAHLAPGVSTLVDRSAQPQSVYSYSVFAVYSGDRNAAPASRQAATATAATDAPSGAGTFTGTVTDAKGHPLLGVEVQAQQAPTVVQAGEGIFFGPGELTPPARTAADGTFTIRGISTASYTLCFAASTHPVSGGDSDTLGYADRCDVNAVEGHSGRATPLGTTALADNTGGLVAGRVVDAGTNAPLANVLVNNEFGSTPSAPRTGAQGAFRWSLPAGTYVFCYDAEFVAGPTGYVSECQDQSPVTVVAGQVTHLTAALTVGGAVTGIVRSSVDGSPVAGADVVSQSGGFGEATTADDGSYTLTGLPAIRGRVCADGFFAAPSSAPFGLGSACTSVRPRSGTTVTAPDIVLDPAGALSGSVTTTNGHPLAGVSVNVSTRRNGFGTTTGADGTYLLPGVPAGTYTVCFDEASYPSQCFNGKAPGQRPTPVTVVAGAETPGVGATLAGKAPGSITITVQDSHGTALVGADAVLVGRCGPTDQFCSPVPVFPKPDGNALDSALTGADGTTTFTDIAPGLYAVCAFGRYATGGTSTTRYQDTCSGSTYSIAIKAGATTQAKLTLADGGAISGTVTDVHGQPLPGVAVDSQFGDVSDGFFSGDQIVTGQDGTYEVVGLPAGIDHLCFDASVAEGTSPTGYVSECYHNARVRPTAINVANGVVTSGIDQQLPNGAAVSGTITGADGLPAAGVAVQAAGPPGQQGLAVTGEDGTYRIIGLPAGSYAVCFDPTTVTDAPPTGYVPDCYLNEPFPNAPTPVTLRAGQTTQNISETLQVGGEITGQLTVGGQPNLDAFPVLLMKTPDGLAGEGGGSDDTGTFEFLGLAPGTYYLCGLDGATGAGACYAGVAWDGQTIPAGATKIKVTTAQVVTANLDISGP